MEVSQDLQETLSDEAAWWAAPDEGYWQALLTQGEFAPDTAPPADYQDIFQSLGVELELESTPFSGDGEGKQGPGLQDVWAQARRGLDCGEVFHLEVTGANKGGLLVEWEDLQGFIPASHLQKMPVNRAPQERVVELSQRIGNLLALRLIEVDPEQNRLVFSERAAANDFRPPSAVLERLEPGDVCQGTVTNLTSFGAFVDLGGVEGLAHISEISWDRIRHPEDVLRAGQRVEVYVLGVNPEEGRVALSFKRLRPDPWTEVESYYSIGQIIDGTVTNVVSFGAFVRVAEGLEGLVHVSELAEGDFMHPRNVVREGDRVRVRVLNVDGPNRRLGLSLRQARGAGPAG